MNGIICPRWYLSTLAIVFFAFPALASAALVNINTADAVLLDTLPGIGPTYATRIVDYRTANGPFARIEDIQNVSGIGPSTYAQIAPLITVGDTSTPTSSATASSTAGTSAPAGGASTYVPPPAAISVAVSGSEDALLEVPVRFFARVTIKGGATDPSARIVWGFGDGSSSEGSVVEKTYRYAGTYLVTATAVDGSASARDELVVTVKSAQVRVASVSGDGITVANDSNERLDLSGWRLTSGASSFRIPDGTALLPRASVLFPFAITNLTVSLDANLLYPNSILASSSVSPALPKEVAVQPSGLIERSTVVQTIINAEPNIQTHEEAGLAPTAAVKPAAVGATPAPPEGKTAAVANAWIPEFFRSPWTLGLLGVIVLAGGAFILL